MNNISIIPNIRNYTNISKTNSLTNFQNSTNEVLQVNIPSETYRAYALSKLSFKGVNQINDISLILTEEKANPRICVEILNNNKFDSKMGVPAVFEIALYDQLHNDIKRNPNLKDENSQVVDYKRRFDVSCPEEDLINTLKMIQDKFINLNVEKRYIDHAKHLAPIGYKLHTLNLESIGNYSDIPKGTTIEDYEQKMEEISDSDIQKFNQDILNNSDTRITLSVNREFYKKHKDEIMPILEKFYER